MKKSWWLKSSVTGRDVSRGYCGSSASLSLARFRLRINRLFIIFPGVGTRPSRITRSIKYCDADASRPTRLKTPFAEYTCVTRTTRSKACAVNEPLELKSTHMARAHVARWIRYEAVRPRLILVLGNLTHLRPPRLRSNAIAWFLSLSLLEASFFCVREC